MVTPASSGPDVPEPLATEAVAEPSLYAPIPGPVDRESFFDAQQKHRRETWRFTALCGFGAILTGIPLSLVLTPLLYLLLLVLTRLVDIVLPIPHDVWDAYKRAGLVFVEIIDSWDDPATPVVSEGDLSRTPVGLALAATAIWVIPGILFMLAIWPALRRLFRQAGAGGVLLSIGAREPNLSDLEERQLVNVIEEMAIADGIPAPKVMLIDANVANAAAIGSSPEDATIVVSRALLDDLDRDETQGVLAHVVASVGNGDLGGALSLIAIFQTFGFASAIVKAPISGPARATVGRVLRYVFGRRKSRDSADEARVVSDMLTGGLWATGDDDFQWMNDESQAPPERPGISFDTLRFAPYAAGAIFIGGIVLEAFDMIPNGATKLLLALFVVGVLWVTWHQREYAEWRIKRLAGWARLMVMLPYYLAAMLPQILLMLLTSFLLEPLISLLWRTRRYLADASAVQLTRNPDGLADGLAALVKRGGIIPGGKWAAPLFVVGGDVVSAKMTELQRQRIDARRQELDPEGDDTGARGLAADLRAVYGAAQPGEMSPAMMSAVAATAQANAAGSFSGSTSNVISFHPPLNKRMDRLRKLGANVAAETKRRMLPQVGKSSALGILLIPVVAVLLAIAAVLLLVVIGLLLVMSVAACGLLMAIVWGLFSVLIGP